MKVAIAADHAGWALKERLAAHLSALGHDVLDLGAHDATPSDYPDHAEAAGRAILDGRAERAILVCGSGVGVAAAANKIRGIRAGLCHDHYSAHQGVEHDSMNVLALGALVVGEALAYEIADAFLAAHFDGERRHARRIAKIRALEARFGEVHMMNPLRELAAHGQSVWYDGFARGLVASGELARMVAEDGLAGLTTNPAIYEKAIAETSDYDADLAALLGRQGLDARAVYEEIAIRDIRAAADLLRPVYDRADRRDGYVSLEVSPAAARDARATVEEATRLWRALDRDNVMIKVPGTSEGVPAIRRLLADGVNVNVTLLFSREAYHEVAEAHLAALEERASRGHALSHVASVASFFVSRIDTEVDRRLDAIAASAAPQQRRWHARALRGRIAVANAKLAYQDWRALVATPRWERLREKGAIPQRLLWASTSTKDRRYRDVTYVEELIGPQTIDTMPPATFAAFRDHGRVGPTLEADLEGARQALSELDALGVSLEEVTARLLEDGVRLFAEPFDRLLAAIGARRGAGAGAHPA